MVDDLFPRFANVDGTERGAWGATAGFGLGIGGLSPNVSAWGPNPLACLPGLPLKSDLGWWAGLDGAEYPMYVDD